MHFDLAFIQNYAPLYAEAAGLALKLAFWGILFSTIVGFVCSLIRYYRVPFLSPVTGAYIELSRNTPLLVQLFFLYFGLPKMGIHLDAEICAVIGLTFLGGSYMAEAFRGGLEAVSKIQIESGLSIGLSTPQLVRYVILPQAFAVAVPALGANVIFLIKETSIFSVMALEDPMFVAKDLIGLYYDTGEALLMLVVTYLIMLLPLSILLTYLEKKVRHAGFGH
ncbi:MAG: amino acid ABC transporter permease [Rhodospirillaceae bacterium]|nr:amino acid ABC transporter permease [Rhodospirillaceae bacterium]